ncbi:MAG TPA: hypothetical protein VNA23_07675 [Anaerolineales bacterium]|nr:hypothetical protein [Anaerolineales bacterium]
MIDQKKRTYQSEALSLLTLKLILTEAKKESLPQMRKEERCDEELALKLIASMKINYKHVVFNPPVLKAEGSSKDSIEKVTVLEP